jgi:putative MATE family efflux protein
MMMQMLSAGAMGGGISSAIARALGGGRRDDADALVLHAIVINLAIGVLCSVLVLVFGPALYRALGGDGASLEAALAYSDIVFAGTALVWLMNALASVIRGGGNMWMPSVSICGGVILLVPLSPCLIFGLGPFPKLGVTGAAVATTIGRGSGALYALSRLFRRGSRVLVAKRHLRLDLPVMRTVARLSGSGALQSVVGMASWIGLVRIVATFGSQALAGYTIGIRVVVFALLPSFGMSNAAATMVGQALGARDPERAERAVWRTCLYNLAFLSAIGLGFDVFARPIVWAFTADDQVLAYGTQCLRIVAAGFAFYAYGMVLSQSFNGAGDTTTPTVIALFVFWIWELPLAWTLSVALGMGPRGAFLAVAVAFSTLAVVAGAIFRRGRWKRVVV